MNKKYSIQNYKNYEERSVFTPENLLREARRQKLIDDCVIPKVCILDPDGDIVEYLHKNNQLELCKYWANGSIGALKLIHLAAKNLLPSPR